MVPRVDTAPQGVEIPAALIAEWLGFVEPAQHEGDGVPPPDRKSLHTLQPRHLTKENGVFPD